MVDWKDWRHKEAAVASHYHAISLCFHRACVCKHFKKTTSFRVGGFIINTIGQQLFAEQRLSATAEPRGKFLFSVFVCKTIPIGRGLPLARIDKHWTPFDPRFDCGMKVAKVGDAGRAQRSRHRHWQYPSGGFVFRDNGGTPIHQSYRKHSPASEAKYVVEHWWTNCSPAARLSWFALLWPVSHPQ